MDIIQTYHKETHGSISSPESMRLAWRTGLGIFGVFISYFFVMQVMGLQKHLLLRSVNFVFLMAGIVYSLKRYSRMRGGKIEYFKGLKLGMLVTAIATVPFAVFVGIWLSLDTSLMNYLQQHYIEMGKYLYPTSAAIAVAMEGLSSGFIVTFVAMPYFKKQ